MWRKGVVNIDVGTALRLSRAYRRETQARVAIALNVSVSALRQYEAGVRDVPPTVIGKAVEHFGMTEWLARALEDYPLAPAYRMLYGQRSGSRKAS